MESFHTQTERQDAGNWGVFNSPGAAVVGINLGQRCSAHGKLASGARLGLSLTPFILHLALYYTRSLPVEIF